MIETEIRELEQFLMDHGYSPDIIKESIAAVREKFPEADIPTGPDTTENIKEVVNDLEVQDHGFELIDSNEDPGKKLYFDIDGKVSDKPSYLSMPKDVADRIAYEHGYHRTPREGEKVFYTREHSGIENHGCGRTPREGEHIQKSERWAVKDDGRKIPGTELSPEEYGKFMQEWSEIEKYHRMPREAADEEVSRWKAHERFIPKKGTKGMKTVYPSIFDNILEQMSDLHARKNSDYGDAAYEGYKEFGITYYIIQLHNKLNRLKSLTKDASKPQVNESIEDTLIDLASYSVMALEALKRND